VDDGQRRRRSTRRRSRSRVEAVGVDALPIARSWITAPLSASIAISVAAAREEDAVLTIASPLGSSPGAIAQW
jgi:hypothetical protein